MSDTIIKIKTTSTGFNAKHHESEFIEELRYNQSTHNLFVTIKGVVYCCHNVPVDVFSQIERGAIANSHGATWNKLVKHAKDDEGKNLYLITKIQKI